MTAILGFLGLGKIQAAVLAVLLAALAFAVWYGRDADRAIVREREDRISAEMQRDQWRNEVMNLRKQMAERARIDADMAKLPEARLRLCVVRGPESGCCKPAPAECAP